MAWSRYDATTKAYRLVVRRNGVNAVAAIATSPVPFDADLGSDARGTRRSSTRAAPPTSTSAARATGATSTSSPWRPARSASSPPPAAQGCYENLGCAGSRRIATTARSNDQLYGGWAWTGSATYTSQVGLYYDDCRKDSESPAAPCLIERDADPAWKRVAARNVL